MSQDGIADKLAKLAPDYMSMGSIGMAEMGMPLPENTLPMMTGDRPHGALEMGGMFTVLKVRDDQKLGDYRDPAWIAAPEKMRARKADTGHNVPSVGTPE